MLKKRSRPFKKDDSASDSSLSPENVVQKSRASPFFSVPGLFIGFTTKNTLDSDSVKSPTSPLIDFKPFTTNLSNSFVRSPRSLAFDCNRVGLSLVNSLNDESKNILLGSQLMRAAVASPKSLPKNYHLDSPKFEIGSFDDEDLKNTPWGSSQAVPNLSGSLPVPTAIELSEDYTCIISHGPNPKTTHIFGDCILDDDAIRTLDCMNNKNGRINLPFDDFLSYCFACKKKLEQGEDVYMYRGDKAFCSSNCRDKEIFSEEETENSASEPYDDYRISSSNEEMFIH